MKKIFMLFAVCMAAVTLSAAELNIFASGLHAGAVNDGKVEISYVLNAPATTGEVQLIGEGGTVVASLPCPDEQYLTKGKHTIEIPLEGIPAGTYHWTIKASAPATEALTMVTETAEGSDWVAADDALIFYSPRGLAINTNPENENFGMIYVSSPMDGADDGGSDASKNHKKGLYAFYPDLTMANPEGNPYLGGLEWTGKAQAPHRLALDENGALYLSSNDAALKGIWRANTSDLAANFVPVTTAENFTGFTALAATADAVYAFDNVGTGEANSQFVKVTADKIDTIAHVAKLANANCSLASDGKGGFFVSQNRWGADMYFALFHMNASGEIDWSAVTYDEGAEKYVSEILPFTANISYRGAMALNADKTKLIMSSDKSAVVFDIAWNEGVPSLTEAFRTPQLASNIDGVGFDYAGNIYVLSASVERLYAFATVKANNVCVTPAPASSTITVESDEPTTWHLTADGELTLKECVENKAKAGDIILLADGTYEQESSISVKKAVTIGAEENAHPVIFHKSSIYFKIYTDVKFEGLKFDGNNLTSEYAIRPYDLESPKKITVEGCEFTQFKKNIITSGEDYHVDEVLINNCYFHDNGRAAVYFPGGLQGQEVCSKLTVTNTTITNISALSGAGPIDIRNKSGEVDEAIELIVDHVTIYNVTGYDRMVQNYKSTKATVTNSIFVQPEDKKDAQYAVYCYGGVVKNNLDFNTLGYREGPEMSGNINKDPLFVDAANGDLTLGEGSPALGAATDGTNLGDPRWWPAGGEVAKVKYVLNDGVTNDYGWTSMSDMFDDFMHTSNPDKEFQTLEYYKAQADPLGDPNICSKLLNPEVAFADAEKWGWLLHYIIDVTNAQNEQGAGATALTEAGSGAGWRYAVGAFFCNTQRASWPKSADFTIAGTPEAFMPAWKHAFVNPGTVTEEFVLNAPYREGYTFDGWYNNAEFTGDKVTTINAETEGTLYAKWVEYIPTIAEFKALPDKTDAKTKGVVTFVQGNNFWIQDAGDGILCYGKNHGAEEGKLVVLEGQSTVYNGSPEVNNAKVVSSEDAAAVTPQTVLIAQIKEPTSAYLNKLIYIEGLKMAEYQDAGNYKNPVVTDGKDSVILYNMGIEEAAVPVGTKLNVKAVLGIYKTTMQLRGHAEWVETASVAGKDAYVYPVRDAEGDFAGYTLQNEWIYAATFDNYSDNLPAPADNARGMAVKDGIMYFANRAGASLTRVDGKTGLMLDPLPITGDHLYQHENYAGTDTAEWVGTVTLAYNDLKFDNAGNALIGCCITNGQRMQIYKVDLETGAATPVIDERLWDNVEAGYDQINFRFDAFGVHGDVTKDAVIMACDANGWNAFRWTIENGVAGPGELVTLEPDENVKSLYIEMKENEQGQTVASWKTANPGTAPQIFPLEGGMFYVDGWSTLPILFDEEGYIIDDFANSPAGVSVVNNEGDTCVMNTGHNGLAEFQIGDEYFLVMAATNTVGNPPSAFALYKYADEAKAFEGLEPLWYFPAAGMGTLTNGCRTAVPSVEVDQETATAKIYVYTNNNGYGVYTMTGKKSDGNHDSLDNIENNVEVRKVVENGHVYIYKNGVKYTVLGAEVKR